MIKKRETIAEHTNKLRMKAKENSKKKKIELYQSVDDVRCPICGGVINEKWFNFRNGDVVEFIAECWSGDTKIETPAHIFRFQVALPPCLLIKGKDNKTFED